jgi:hypothetical protein
LTAGDIARALSTASKATTAGRALAGGQRQQQAPIVPPARATVQPRAPRPDPVLTLLAALRQRQGLGQGIRF